jgi:hypothetical protein
MKYIAEQVGAVQQTVAVHTRCGKPEQHNRRQSYAAATPHPTHLPMYPCTLPTLAAQVSHHPPIGAGHAETELWSYDLVSAPKTKFLGNSVEVYPIGELDF